MFEQILLTCFQSIHKERSAASVYHLLIGKRSSQTIQDAKVFGVDQYFGIYKELRRDQFEQVLRKLMNEQLVYIENKRIFITSVGLRALENKEVGVNWLDGYSYHQSAPAFWLRLLLFIQIGSNMLGNEKTFLPVIEDRTIVQWTKRFYARHKSELESVFFTLYEELHQILSDLPTDYASMVVSRMSGAHRYGASTDQIAKKHNASIHDVKMTLQSCIHFIMKEITRNQTSFPALNQFIPEHQPSLPLTLSTKKTYDMLKQGHGINDLARIRGLKVSTIQDHIVEIAHVDRTFDIRPFISEHIEKQIIAVVERTKTKRLKEIKEALEGNVDYFSIRVVLARAQFQEKGGE
ncbi:helix-turn-helix domain-containing protein [Salirhabdus salicampi]|uniref:helix-turn-helix domain-containing protein n=1 Tax=Salirhabdus salicampi TaxID=476102 RepID=UPI0020C2C85A|nr:helix-turn-helix domain-containing protein [Salirhabdus salicampi]